MGLFSFIKDLNSFFCSGMSTASQKAKEVNEEVTARCSENTLELVKRTKNVEEELKKLGLESIEEANEYILNCGKPTKKK